MEETKSKLSLALTEDSQARTGCLVDLYTFDPARTEAQRAEDAAFKTELKKFFGDCHDLFIELPPPKKVDRGTLPLRPEAWPLPRWMSGILELNFSTCSSESISQGFATLHSWLDNKAGRRAYLAEPRTELYSRQQIDITNKSEAAVLKILQQHGQE